MATLNANGQLDGMLFVPEVFVFRGRHAGPIMPSPSMRAVMDERTGWQAGCLISWKEAWPKPVIDKAPGEVSAIDELGTNSRDVPCQVYRSECVGTRVGVVHRW
jgi:hypothetical protein